MKKRVLLPLMLCLALALAFGVTACGGTDDDGNGPSTDPVTHTVTYVAGNADATGTAPTQTAVEEGKTFTVAENTFTLEGHTFAGWSDGSKTYAAGDTYTMGTANVTLTAQWTVNEYSVTYAAGSEDAVGTLPTQADVAYGAAFTVAANPFTVEGRMFMGWQDGNGVFYDAGDTYTIGTEAVTLTGVWLDTTLIDVSMGENYTMTFADGICTHTFDNPTNPTYGWTHTYTYTIDNGVVYCVEQVEEDSEAEPTTMELIGCAYGFLLGSSGSSPVTMAEADKTAGSSFVDATMLPPTSEGPDPYIYLFTDDTVFYSVYGTEGTSYYVGSIYVDDNDIGTITHSDGSTMVFKIIIAHNVPCYVLNDGLGGTYTSGETELVLDGYLGCTIDGVIGTYTEVADGMYLITDDDGNAYFATLDNEAFTAVLTVPEVYTYSGEESGAFTMILYADGIMLGQTFYGGSTALTKQTDGTYADGYAMYTAEISSDGNTITVEYESTTWDPDQGGLVTQDITETYTKA